MSSRNDSKTLPFKLRKAILGFRSMFVKVLTEKLVKLSSETRS